MLLNWIYHSFQCFKRLVRRRGIVLEKQIHLAFPHMSEEGYELEYVQEAFDTNWIAPLSENVDKFESELAEKVRIKAAAALASGTAAIHLALKAVGVEQGDLVFCQSLTFAASANPIIYQGAMACVYRF